MVALDCNPAPNPAKVPVLWLGEADWMSAIVKMDHPGVWVMGDLADDDRHHGMGIVVEYARRAGKPQWIAPPAIPLELRWFCEARCHRHFARSSPSRCVFAEQNTAGEGFNRWTPIVQRVPCSGEVMPASFHLKRGKRYRIHLRNASDDIHPIHLHRHSFELTNLASRATAGIMKDVVMLGGYQESSIDFVADNPGLTLFHCHQQLHMDFGFMTLFDYV